MEQSHQTKQILTILAVLLVVVLGYLFYAKYRLSKGDTMEADDVSSSVTVESTPTVNRVVTAPPNFPQDIPVEKGGILESATTHYAGQDTKQLSIIYQSSKTVGEKYAEYQAYLKKAGYKVTESNTSASLKALFGTKVDANLSVVISKKDKKTLVQLSYLLK